MTWTPTANMRGLEWAPMLKGSRRVNGSRVAALSFIGQGDTLASIWLYCDSVVGGATFVADLYPASGVEFPSGLSTSVHRPSADKSSTGNQTTGRTNGTAHAAPWYVDIDESTLDVSDDVIVADNNTGALPSFLYNLGAGSLPSTPRILEVRQLLATDGLYPRNFQIRVRIDGTNYDFPIPTFPSGQGGITTVTARADRQNPATQKQWLKAAIDAFATTDSVGLASTTNSAGGGLLQQAWMEVDFIPETRQRTGSATVSMPGWQQWIMRDPGTLAASPITLTNGTEYIAVISTLDGEMSVPGIDSRLAGQANGHSSFEPELDLVSGVYVIRSLGPRRTRAHSLVVANSTPVATASSQPYVTYVAEEVYTGRSVQQELTPGAITAGWMRFSAAKASSATTASLVAQIRRRSDNVAMGSAVTITAAEIIETPGRFALIARTLAAGATLAAATQYYVEWTATAAVGAGWLIPVLDSKTAPVSGDAVGFGGTTDAATVAGTRSTAKDVGAVVASVPAAPSGLTASVLGTGATARVRLSWTATTLGASFGAIEVYRSAVRIGESRTEATTTWDDYEAASGVVESYTLRVRDSFGVASAATSAATATIPAEDWRLASNESPALGAMVGVVGPLRYRLPEAEPAVIHAYGRNNAIVIRGTEDRGDDFTVTVRILIGALQDRAAYDALVTLARSGLSHVAVCSPFGRRWYAALLIEEAVTGTVSWDGTVPVRVREVSDTPVVVVR